MIVSLLLYLLVIRSMALSPRQDRPSTTMVMVMCMTFDSPIHCEGHDQDDGYDDDDGHVFGNGLWPRCETHIVTVVATAIVKVLAIDFFPSYRVAVFKRTRTDGFALPALLV
jgi:hypothetical protein